MLLTLYPLFAQNDKMKSRLSRVVFVASKTPTSPSVSNHSAMSWRAASAHFLHINKTIKLHVSPFLFCQNWMLFRIRVSMFMPVSERTSMFGFSRFVPVRN